MDFPINSSARRLKILCAVSLSVWTLWFVCLGIEGFSYLRSYWEIVTTMIAGSFIAGATSVGGGAVAFPVFTKLLEIGSGEAKTFSLAIQSVGMGTASLVIILTQIKVEWKIIFYASLSGAIGIYLGMSSFGLFSPGLVKMSFSLMMASFAFTLFLLNRNDRRCHNNMPIWRGREKSIILAFGFLGGILSGIVGSGIDIFLFAAMVLLFRINEKVATPTSVILMAINAFIGSALQLFQFGGFSEDVEGFWLAAVPVVVVGAPLGALICNILDRRTIANFLIGLIFIEFISSLMLIPLTMSILFTGAIILLLFTFLNNSMYASRTYEPTKYFT
jgi:uncharacterized membrane protein YfcA